MHVNDEERIKHIREAALEACGLIRDETRQEMFQSTPPRSGLPYSLAFDTR
jgi:hypothetical protein